MFSSIKTSKANKEVITELTNKLGLGAENVIARLSLSYSLSYDSALELDDIKDSQGKEYSRKILLGDYDAFYIALICQKYGIYKSNRDIPRYIKLHLDRGLEKLYNEIKSNKNKDGISFLVEKVEKSLPELG